MVDSAQAAQKSRLEATISALITEVRPGELGPAFILTLDVFLLLLAYYLIKPVREALILVRPDGAELKSYMSGVIAVALLFAVPAYASATNRLPRNKLVVGVTLFFSLHLVLFWVASLFEPARAVLAILFFVWMGVFSMMVVAQFWAFANDLYTEEQGKRLFALLGVGAALGAWLGSAIASVAIERLGLYPMLLAAAGLLVVCALLSAAADRQIGGAKEKAAAAQPAGGTGGAFGLILENRYLLYIAAFSLIFTLVNTNGEYMLSRLVKAEAERLLAAGELSGDKGTFIGSFYGSFFSWVNVAGLVLQLFVVSRLVKLGGIRLTFLVLPVIALADAVAVAALPLLAVIRVGKTAENSVDYSVNNTARNMLWLPTTREIKYKAKQAADTFFVRMGDVSSALLVYLGTTLSWEVRPFAIINVVLVGVWLALAVAIVRENARLSAEAKP